MKIRLVISSLLLLVAVVGCAAKPHMNVPMVWKPTSDLYDGKTTNLSNFYSKKFSIQPFNDKRENKKEFGKYIEDGKNLTVSTKDDVSVWCTEKFKSIFSQYGASVVDVNPNVIIKGDILHFYVTEDKTYKANVGIKITAEDKTGKILWQGVITGSAKRFGHSYKLENYYETISDSYLEAVTGLLQNSTFIQAL